MTTNETCPYCGAEIFEERSAVEFLCGTLKYTDGTFLLHKHCYERQIAAQAAEIDRLTERNKILEENELCISLCY